MTTADETPCIVRALMTGEDVSDVAGYHTLGSDPVPQVVVDMADGRRPCPSSGETSLAASRFASTTGFSNGTLAETASTSNANVSVCNGSRIAIRHRA